ncbi:hypothetical protein PF011_g32093 [Phytophthora fragariae]|uniref:Uncharacterized protein n=1 Tax=Phytophthora fragariae TaxID=53985 RepID=A0A6A3GAU2_9STRA|nr:hypothetical protein PF011_g32093 [Phytophthora fragariae]
MFSPTLASTLLALGVSAFLVVRGIRGGRWLGTTSCSSSSASSPNSATRLRSTGRGVPILVTWSDISSASSSSFISDKNSSSSSLSSSFISPSSSLTWPWSLTSSNSILGVSSGVTIATATATLAESASDRVEPLALPAGLALLEDDPLDIFSLFSLSSCS